MIMGNNLPKTPRKFFQYPFLFSAKQEITTRTIIKFSSNLYLWFYLPGTILRWVQSMNQSVCHEIYYPGLIFSTSLNWLSQLSFVF